MTPDHSPVPVTAGDTSPTSTPASTSSPKEPIVDDKASSNSSSTATAGAVDEAKDEQLLAGVNESTGASKPEHESASEAEAEAGPSSTIRPEPEAEQTEQQDGSSIDSIDPAVVNELGDHGIDFLADALDDSALALDRVMDGTVNEVMDIQMDDGGWSDGDNHELKRVKVYELIGQRWIDQGTAFCLGHYDDATGDASIIARSEADFKTVILTTTIRGQDVYQRQQDTLIVWTEPSGVDYALSFQDPEGCASVWQFIEDVQQHLPSDEDRAAMESADASEQGGPSLPLSEVTMTGPRAMSIPDIVRSGHLPPPQLGFLPQVEKAIKALCRTPALKERICDYLQAEEYVKLMVDTLSQAEDLESIPDLHALCNLMQTIITLNHHDIFEHIIDDDIFLGVLGMLEYDPDFPTYKANYREFLQQSSHFHQPVVIRNNAIVRKVHGTYRLQFLKDVVLARSIDDSTFNVLNSCIIFNQIDIITFVQQDGAFLPEIIGVFCDDSTLKGAALNPKPLERPEIADDLKDQDDDELMEDIDGEGAAVGAPTHWEHDGDARRAEITLLVQQLCAMGKNIQLPARIPLFRTLVERGILFCAQWALGTPEKHPHGPRLIAAAGEILTTLLDHALDQVRSHVNRQAARFREHVATHPAGSKAETVLLVMCRVMATSRDLAVQSLVGDALKVVLEVPLPEPEPPGAITPMKMINQTKQNNPEAERFIMYFYSDCADTLFKPLEDIPEFKTHTYPVLQLSREKTNLYLYLCDLLTAAAQQHKVEGHNFIHRSSCATRLATLLRARDKHLRLAALRFFRMLIKMDKGLYFDYLRRHGVVGPILELTTQESRRDNLLSASCHELFEHMRKENLRDWIDHIMKDTDHEAKVRALAATQLGREIFEGLIRRWEQNNEPPPPPGEEGAAAMSSSPSDTRQQWGQGRAMEAEEEDYFLHDDDDDSELVVRIVPEPPVVVAQVAQSLKRKRARQAGIPAGRMGRAAKVEKLEPKSSALVDYADDDDNDVDNTDGEHGHALESGDEGDEVVPPSQSPSPAAERAESPAPSSDLPPSPRLPHRQVKRGSLNGNGTPATVAANTTGTTPDADALMAGAPPSPSLTQTHSLLTPSATPTTPSKPLGNIAPIRSSEKRRRAAGEADEDDNMERLASKRRPSAADQREKEKEKETREAKEAKEDGIRKIKLKLGAGIGIVSAAATPAPTPAPVPTPKPHIDAKDGDTG